MESALTHAPRARLSSRLLFAACTLIYAAALVHCYLSYLNPVWDYFGFKLAPLTGDRLAFGLVALTATALCQQHRLVTPAALIVFILYFNVFVPGVVTSLLLTADAIERYGAILVCMALVFISAGLSLRQQSFDPRAADRIDPALERFVLIVWMICGVALVLAYASVMNLASLDDQSTIYEQRELGTARSPVLGYLQTFFSNIFNPTLLLIGLYRKRHAWTIGGLLGGVLMYSITAQRTVLMLPMFVVLIFMLLNSRRFAGAATYIIMLFLAAAMVVANEFQEDNLFAAAVALLLTFRTVAIPGLTISQYHDLFGEIGFTFWSHVKGFDLFVPAPHYAHGDHLWPNLGYIVGDKTYGAPAFNVNANLFAGDGVAAAGAIGVLVIGLVFIAWIKWIDRLARPWSPLFATMALLPPAISLTNGHFFTTLLSFGGLFWIVAFKYFKPVDPAQTRS